MNVIIIVPVLVQLLDGKIDAQENIIASKHENETRKFALPGHGKRSNINGIKF